MTERETEDRRPLSVAARCLSGPSSEIDFVKCCPCRLVTKQLSRLNSSVLFRLKFQKPSADPLTTCASCVARGVANQARSQPGRTKRQNTTNIPKKLEVV